MIARQAGIAFGNLGELIPFVEVGVIVIAWQPRGCIVGDLVGLWRVGFVLDQAPKRLGVAEGRAIVVIIGAIAELERSLIVERVRAGMRRARLEGQHIGRRPLELDQAAIHQDRQHGQSLRQIARGHRISTATVQRVLRRVA